MLIAKHAQALLQPVSPVILAGLWSEPTVTLPARILFTAQWLLQASRIVILHAQDNMLIGMEAVGQLVATQMIMILMPRSIQKQKALMQNVCILATRVSFSIGIIVV